MMFELVAVEAVEEVLIYPDPLACSACATEMRHLGAGIEGNFPAGVANAALPIGFFGVHEEALIEAPCLLVDLPPQQHARADDPLDVALAIVRPMPVIAENGVIAEGGGDPEVFAP